MKTDWEVILLGHCRIEMKIEGTLRIISISCFLFSLHHDMLSIYCSRIQSCMLSLMNGVNPCVAFATCFVWDAKLPFFNIFIVSLQSNQILIKTPWLTHHNPINIKFIFKDKENLMIPNISDLETISCLS